MNFLNIFASSPFKPLQEHMRKVHTAVNETLPFFAAVFARDWEDAAQHHAQIVTLEQEADILKQQIRLHMPNSLFMPVARTDLLELLTVQDALANKAKDIAGLILGRKIEFPAAIVDKFEDFVKRCVDATTQALNSVSALDELLETGFKGREAEVVEKMVMELDRVEAETDAMQIEIRKLLFAAEKDLPPVNVIFLYRIIDGTGELADLAEKVGHRLQLLLAR